MSNPDKNNGVNKSVINWYPGHMAKTKRQIKENISLVDVVYEVIDARIPASSKIKDIDDLIGNKPRIIIMTKTDLCDYDKTVLFKKYYEEKGYRVIMVDLLSNKGLNNVLNVTKDVLKELNENRLKKGLKPRKYRALIIGIPNVGKSTLINKLVGKKAAITGDKPGVTKSLSWIRVSDDLELLDSPGILWPKLDNDITALNLAAFSAIKEEILPIDKVAVYILDTLNNKYQKNLIDRYGITDFNLDDVIPTYDKIGKKRGCIVSGGEIDYNKVSALIIKDLREGYLGKITFDEV